MSLWMGETSKFLSVPVQSFVFQMSRGHRVGRLLPLRSVSKTVRNPHKEPSVEAGTPLGEDVSLKQGFSTPVMLATWPGV